MADLHDPAVLRSVIETITAWRNDPESAARTCPDCGDDGLVLTDCSARPHTEWYRLQCAACGFDEMVSIPLGGGGFAAVD